MKIKSVYIVDDDSITIFGLKKLLSKYDPSLNISEFKNGKQALDAIINCLKNNTSLPEVIFLDINMPVMDGWTFLEEFLNLSRTENTFIKIITSSIDARDHDKWKAFKQKAPNTIDFITKPVFSLKLTNLMDDIDLAS